MCQAKVLKLLKKYPNRKFTTREINKILNYTNSAENLKRLYNQGEIRRVEEQLGIRKLKQFVYFIK